MLIQFSDILDGKLRTACKLRLKGYAENQNIRGEEARKNLIEHANANETKGGYNSLEVQNIMTRMEQGDSDRNQRTIHFSTLCEL